MLGRPIPVAGGYGKPAAPVTALGKTRVEGECPINQGESSIDVLAETTQRYGGAAEDPGVVSAGSKGLPREIDRLPAVLLSLAVIAPIVIFEVDPVGRRRSESGAVTRIARNRLLEQL